MIKATAVVLIGPQGCGKGTQAELLERDLGFVNIAMSKLLDSVEDPDFKREAALCMARGELVPDQLTIGVLEKHLQANVPLQANVVFDGVPRQIGQATLLHEILCERGMVPRYFIFELNDETARQRIAERIRQCRAHGLPVREDDLKPEVVTRRLTTYRERLASMTNYLGYDVRASITYIPEGLTIQGVSDMILSAMQSQIEVLI